MPNNNNDTRTDNTLLLDIWQRLSRIEAQTDLIIKAQGEAVESRKGIYERLEKFGMIAETVKRLEPIVSELDRIRERAIGMKLVVKILWGFLGMLAAFAGFMGHWLLYGSKGQ
jgi:hypothetical protein